MYHKVHFSHPERNLLNTNRDGQKIGTETVEQSKTHILNSAISLVHLYIFNP